MVATKKYSIIDAQTGALDRRIFVDADIYKEELEKIFGRAWQMIGHVSLVAKPNDFFHTYMGEDPVILTRDNNGQLHAFLNMCRHRGNRIVRADEGNAKNFMCTYHGWTFSNDGRLEHVPGVSEAYYDDLPMEELSLIEAKVDTYAGIVFATWDHESPSLEAYLGDARWYLDTAFNRRAAGTVAVGPMKWLEPCNWKTPVDNCSDNYHVPISHASSMIAQEKVQGRGRVTQERQLSTSNFNHMFVNGHALTTQELDDGDEDSPRYFHGVTQDNVQQFRDWQREALEHVEERLGAYRARKLNLTNHSLFPNGVLGLRLALPRGPLMTEFWHFVRLRGRRAGGYRHGAADGPRQQQRRRGPVRAGRHRQLAPGQPLRHKPDRPQARARPLYGRRPRQRRQQTPRRGVGALHLREQPAQLLSPLGRIHERRVVGGHPPRPHHRQLRGRRHPARLTPCRPSLDQRLPYAPHGRDRFETCPYGGTRSAIPAALLNA